MCRPEPLHFTYTFYHKSGTASIERSGIGEREKDFKRRKRKTSLYVLEK